MANVAFHKVLTLPETLEANAIYFVQNGGVADTVLTDTSGQPKKVGNTAMINSLVDAAMAEYEGGAGPMPIVPDIAARDSLIETLTKNKLILVLDATDDATVNTGAALYVYDAVEDETHKVAEYESMDVELSWANIAGTPNSTPSQIDQAVQDAHAHANKTVLDDLSDVDGVLHYDGEPVTTQWGSTAW